MNKSNVSGCSRQLPYQVEPDLTSYLNLVVLVLILILGLLGNSVLITIITVEKRMRTLPNLLLVNLAVGDMIFLLSHVTLSLPSHVQSTYFADSATCKLHNFVRLLTLGVSIFTLMLLAVDRLRVVVCPLRHQLTHDHSRLLGVLGTAIIWVAAVAIAARTLFSSQVIRVNIPPLPAMNSTISTTTTDGTVSHVCYFLLLCTSRYDFDSQQEKLTQFAIRFTAFFLLPFLVISGCYISIAIFLFKRNTSPSVVRLVQPSSPLQLNTIISRRKLAKLVLALVLVFVVCKLPEQLYTIYATLAEHVYKSVQMSFLLLSYTYACINPVSLCVLSQSYRRRFFACMFRCTIDRHRHTNAHRPYHLQATEGGGRSPLTDLDRRSSLSSTNNNKILHTQLSDMKAVQKRI